MNIHGISESELEIMRVIWSEGGRVFLAPLMGKLEAMGKQWKTNTVQTFLTRLVDKGLLAVEKDRRYNEYVALCTEAEHTESLTRSFLGKFYEGNAKSLVAALLMQDCLSVEDIAELQEYWKSGKKQYE